MDGQQLTKYRQFTAKLTQQEYLALRVDVARTGVKLIDWITWAIQEKLEKIKEEK